MRISTTVFIQIMKGKSIKHVDKIKTLLIFSKENLKPIRYYSETPLTKRFKILFIRTLSEFKNASLLQWSNGF